MEKETWFRPELLALAAFLATMPCFSPNLAMFDGLANSSVAVPWFVNGSLGIATVVGLAAAAVSYRRGPSAFASCAWSVFGAVCSIVSFAMLLVAAGVLEGGAAELACAAGLLAGTGAVLLCIGWFRVLSFLDLKRSLLWLGLMAAAASAVNMLLPSVALLPGLCVFALMLVAGVSVPCIPAFRGRSRLSPEHDGDGLPSDEEYEGMLSSQGGAASSLLRRMASVLAVPFTGLLVLAFMSGVRKFVLFGTIYGDVLGMLAGSLGVVALCLFARSRLSMPLVFRVILPAFVLVLVVLNSFPEGSVFLWLAAWLSYAFYGVVAVVAVSVLCAAVHSGEFSPALVGGASIAAFCLASALGIFCGAHCPVFSDGGGPALLVASTGYFAFLTGMALKSGWQARFDSDRKGGSTGLEDRCREIAQNGALSPRESEILAYLGRGYGAAFVAKTLVISESTVRTHMKNIYRKLGVSSREELLQLIDSGE